MFNTQHRSSELYLPLQTKLSAQDQNRSGGTLRKSKSAGKETGGIAEHEAYNEKTERAKQSKAKQQSPYLDRNNRAVDGVELRLLLLDCRQLLAAHIMHQKT